MANDQTNQNPQADEQDADYYDRIRAEVREKQKAVMPTDAASIFERLNGQPATINNKEQKR